MIKTYQDLLEVGKSEDKKALFVLDAISNHKASEAYQTACDAEQYARGKNATIMKYQKLLYTVTGEAIPDNYSANHKCASGFFKRFVTQEAAYLLGNGVNFTGNEIEVPIGTEGAKEKIISVTVENGKVNIEKKWFLTVDIGTKNKLGKNFDQNLYFAAKSALIQKVAFGFWNLNHVEVFKLTEFVPLYDEEDGALKSGIRFWQIDSDKPLRATLFELDGYTDYIKRKDKEIEVLHKKRPYIIKTEKSVADGERIYDFENYPEFPIVPLWGNPEKQSELEGRREQIDCYDFIKSGFANDLDEASAIYWVLKNAGGMDDIDLVEFKKRMQTIKVANVTGDEGATAEAHTLNVPYQGREACLARLEKDLYKDFMALDTEQIAAGNVTATQIDAAYEPLNEKADEFELCVINFIQGILRVAGVEEDNPTFKRSQISNQKEYVEMVLQCAEYLDDETVLELLPFVTPEMKEAIMQRRVAEESDRFALENNNPPEPEEGEE